MIDAQELLAAITRDEASFWRHVTRGAPEDCWEWTGHCHPQGYGQFAVRLGAGRGRQQRAHRLSYILANGLFDLRLFVCHSCDNPPCVNPAHLWLGDNSANIKDAYDKGIVRQPHCDAARLARGSRVGTAKLTERDVHHIRSLPRPFNQQALARQLGVTKGAVHQILKGKTWTHI